MLARGARMICDAEVQLPLTFVLSQRVFGSSETRFFLAPHDCRKLTTAAFHAVLFAVRTSNASMMRSRHEAYPDDVPTMFGRGSWTQRRSSTPDLAEADSQTPHWARLFAVVGPLFFLREFFRRCGDLDGSKRSCIGLGNLSELLRRLGLRADTKPKSVNRETATGSIEQQ